eukprot:1156229-Pelagomonas_calceolata.AAC.9
METSTTRNCNLGFQFSLDMGSVHHRPPCWNVPTWTIQHTEMLHVYFTAYIHTVLMLQDVRHIPEAIQGCAPHS